MGPNNFKLTYMGPVSPKVQTLFLKNFREVQIHFKQRENMANAGRSGTIGTSTFRVLCTKHNTFWRQSNNISVKLAHRSPCYCTHAVGQARRRGVNGWSSIMRSPTRYVEHSLLRWAYNSSGAGLYGVNKANHACE